MMDGAETAGFIEQFLMFAAAHRWDIIFAILTMLGGFFFTLLVTRFGARHDVRRGNNDGGEN